ncbi:MAG TPA: hypothetical protein PKA58_35330 [Polyangium sp.]|nr:hypothetical protein [Polyangium sp.]
MHEAEQPELQLKVQAAPTQSIWQLELHPPVHAPPLQEQLFVQSRTPPALEELVIVPPVELDELSMPELVDEPLVVDVPEPPIPPFPPAPPAPPGSPEPVEPVDSVGAV